jgi:phosphate acetyltransferase
MVFPDPHGGATAPDVLQLSAGCPPLRLAVCHPCDERSLAATLAAVDRGLIEPVLVGPEQKIRQIAQAAGLGLGETPIVDVPHSHAAAAESVARARCGDVAAIMKGSLHTDELMAEVIAADSGLRTGRRMSHDFVMRVAAYPRLLHITDAAVNIAPTLEHKIDIVQNAIDLAQALGTQTPRVAILSAVETVTSKLRSTLDAAALCKMADRGQITGGILDGPLAFDNAVSLTAAGVKGIHSPVAGVADVLVVPDMETGNMLAKQLEYFAGAESAGIVLGARVPIVLTSRADPVDARVRSCAIASLLRAHAFSLRK